MRRSASLLVVLCMALAACGTRLDDAAFEVGFAGSEEGVRTGPQRSLGDGDDTVDPGDGLAADPAFAEADPGADSTGGGGHGGGTGAPGQGGGGSGGDPGAAGGGGGGGGENTASDVGVTPTSIKVGNIVSRNGVLGPNQFTPSYFGANAYFQLINARGGVNGRRIEYVTCDDREEPGDNIRCAQQLIEQEQVFAFVANNMRAYSSAKYVSESGTPDVGGQPIGSAAYTYPGIYNILGSTYDADGSPGHNGKLYWHSGLHRWFKENLGVSKAGVVYYSDPASKQFGLVMAESLRQEGYEVVEFEVNPALPAWTSYVATMQQRGVDAIFDAVDVNANQNLCRAMESRNFSVKAKVSTIAAWSQTVGNTFPQICKDGFYVSGYAVPMSETSNPEVAQFRDTMRRVYGGQFEGRLHQWAFEGWLGARFFIEGVERMGGDVTRDGLKRWIEGLKEYTFGGLGTPRQWHSLDWDNPPARWCIGVSKWNDAAGDFTTVAGITNCPTGTWVPYQPM